MSAIDYISKQVPIQSIGTKQAEDKIGKIISVLKKRGKIRDSVEKNLYMVYGIGAGGDEPEKFNIEEWVRVRIRFFGGFKINGVNILEPLQNPEIVELLKSKNNDNIKKLYNIYKNLAKKCPKSADSGETIIPIAEPFSGQPVSIFVQASVDGRLKWLEGRLEKGLAKFEKKYIDSEDSIVQVRVGYDRNSRYNGEMEYHTDSIIRNGANPEIVPIEAGSLNDFDIVDNIGPQRLNLYQKCEQAMETIVLIDCTINKTGSVCDTQIESLKRGEGTKIVIPIGVGDLSDMEWDLDNRTLLRHVSQSKGSESITKSALKNASNTIKNLNVYGEDDESSKGFMNSKYFKAATPEQKKPFRLGEDLKKFFGGY